MLTTHPLPVPRLRKSRSYTSCRPKRLHGGYRYHIFYLIQTLFIILHVPPDLKKGNSIVSSPTKLLYSVLTLIDKGSIKKRARCSVYCSTKCMSVAKFHANCSIRQVFPKCTVNMTDCLVCFLDRIATVYCHRLILFSGSLTPVLFSKDVKRTGISNMEPNVNSLVQQKQAYVSH
jgi:hypothetical protein